MIRTIKSRPYAAGDIQRFQKEIEANDAKRLEIIRSFKPPKELYSDKFDPVHKLFVLKSDKISLLTRMVQAMVLGYRNILERKSCPDVEAKKFVDVMG